MSNVRASKVIKTVDVAKRLVVVRCAQDYISLAKAANTEVNGDDYKEHVADVFQRYLNKQLKKTAGISAATAAGAPGGNPGPAGPPSEKGNTSTVVQLDGGSVSREALHSRSSSAKQPGHKSTPDTEEAAKKVGGANSATTELHSETKAEIITPPYIHIPEDLLLQNPAKVTRKEYYVRHSSSKDYFPPLSVDGHTIYYDVAVEDAVFLEDLLKRHQLAQTEHPVVKQKIFCGRVEESTGLSSTTGSTLSNHLSEDLIGTNTVTALYGLNVASCGGGRVRLEEDDRKTVSKALSLKSLARMLDAFERTAAGTHPISLNQAQQVLQKLFEGDKFKLTSWVVTEIYKHWLRRRGQFNKPLLRQYWPLGAPNDITPFVTFRPRVKEKMSLRRPRRNMGDTSFRISHFVQDFASVLEILRRMKQRDQKKLLLAEVDAFLFNQMRHTIQDPRYVTPTWADARETTFRKQYERIKRADERLTLSQKGPDTGRKEELVSGGDTPASRRNSAETAEVTAERNSSLQAAEVVPEEEDLLSLSETEDIYCSDDWRAKRRRVESSGLSAAGAVRVESAAGGSDMQHHHPATLVDVKTLVATSSGQNAFTSPPFTSPPFTSPPLLRTSLWRRPQASLSSFQPPVCEYRSMVRRTGRGGREWIEVERVPLSSCAGSLHRGGTEYVVFDSQGTPQLVQLTNDEGGRAKKVQQSVVSLRMMQHHNNNATTCHDVSSRSSGFVPAQPNSLLKVASSTSNNNAPANADSATAAEAAGVSGSRSIVDSNLDDSHCAQPPFMNVVGVYERPPWYYISPGCAQPVPPSRLPPVTNFAPLTSYHQLYTGRDLLPFPAKTDLVHFNNVAMDSSAISFRPTLNSLLRNVRPRVCLYDR